MAAVVACGSLLAMSLSADSVSERAKKLTYSAIVLDTHDDTTQRLLDPKFDLGVRHSDGSVDIPRMKEGGLDGIFFSIWIFCNIINTVSFCLKWNRGSRYSWCFGEDLQVFIIYFTFLIPFL